MSEYEETIPDKTGKCVVCGHQTHDRVVTLSHTTGKVAYRTWRCGDFEPCKERRAAKKKQNQPRKANRQPAARKAA